MAWQHATYTLLPPSSTSAIWAATVALDGSHSDPFQVSDDSTMNETPDIAYSASAQQTLVVWSSKRQFGLGIRARRLSGGVPASPAFMMGFSYVDRNPHVVGGPDFNWTVTWQGYNGANRSDDIKLMTVPSSTSGDLTGPVESIRNTPISEARPVVALRGDGVEMVAFEEGATAVGVIGLVINTKGPFGDYDWHYTYDALGRMTSACSDWEDGECFGNVWQYQHDGAGNLTLFDHWDASLRQTVTAQYVINGANQIECIDADGNGSCNGTEFRWEYDAYGNLTNNFTSQYQYNAAGQLSQVNVGGVGTTYYYNGDGERVSQRVGGIPITTTTYLLDVAASTVLSQTTDGQTTYYLNGLAPIAQFDGTTTLYNQYDGVGSVRQMTDPSGSVQHTQTFDPFGNPYSETGTDPSMFGFGGGIKDANGLMYWKGQYYSPLIGLSLQAIGSKIAPTWSARWDQAQWISRSPYASGSQKSLANTYLGLSTAAVPLALVAGAVCAIAEPCGTGMAAGMGLSAVETGGEVAFAYYTGSPEERAWAREYGVEHVLYWSTMGGLMGGAAGPVYQAGRWGRVALDVAGVAGGTYGAVATGYQVMQRGLKPVDVWHLGWSAFAVGASAYDLRGALTARNYVRGVTGKVTNFEGRSYVVDLGSSPDEVFRAAAKEYISIAQDNQIIQNIHKWTGIPEEVLLTARTHLMDTRHKIAIGPNETEFGYFEPDGNYAELWRRASHNDFDAIYSLESFKSLVAHEYVESRLMNAGLPFKSANESAWKMFQGAWDSRPNATHFGADNLAPRSWDDPFWHWEKFRLPFDNTPVSIRTNLSDLDTLVAIIHQRIGR